MLLPVGEPLSVRVDVIHVSSPALSTRAGWIRRFDDGVYEVDLEEDAADIAEGSRVVLNWAEAPGRRVTATVVHRQGRRLEAQEKRAQRPDHRIWPRQVGGVDLCYRVLDAGADQERRAWMDGELGVDDRWHRPDPFMNFSVTGLRFDDGETCRSGDTLLCELGIPGEARRWRGIARVVRVWPIPEGEQDPTSEGASHRVAVQFTDLPSDAAEALTHYTLRMQRTAL